MTQTKDNKINSMTCEISFRQEQEAAIEQTVKSFMHNRKMLWNAKMRFGKTLCALEVAHRCEYKRTLILTHRPAVRAEWFEALQKLGYKDWLYGGKCNGCNSDSEDIETLEDKCKANTNIHYIFFASMQDLRGSKRINPVKGTDKNNNIFDTKWDLLIIDEAHEGILTKLGQDVIGELQKRRNVRTLYLSGTPYNIQSLFDTTEVFHWDYSMEQACKEGWNKVNPGKPNPYEGMATMNILTYNLSRDFKFFRTIDSNGFNFSEFFRVTEDDENKPRFAHESDVRRFLKLIGGNSSNAKYPYADKKLSASMSHTLWYLPGVKAAHCLAELLSENDKDNYFRDYKIINVAGNGNSLNERLDAIEQTRKEKDALERVKSAVKENKKTITLSCGRLTMGVSVPEWTAVLMLAGSDTGSARYFQTIFRCQSPYKNGGIKHNCYAIDFSPIRTITVIDQYINNNTSDGSQQTRIEQIERFLHYCPLTEINSTKVIHFDAEHFINDINRTYSENLIRKGFRDDCLYGNLDNLKQQDIKLLDQVAEAISLGITAERQQNREQIAKKGSLRTKRKKANDKKSDNQELTHVSRLTPRQRAIAILSQISMRFPLMIYGAIDNIEGLSLDSFISKIDPESWNEFMPKGISMKLFQKLKRFYREDIFVATAKAIVERLHKADTLPINERVNEIASILSDFCYPDRETILTPWKIVNLQLSETIGGYCFFNEKFDKQISDPRFVYNGEVTEKVLMNHNTRILDMSSKTGLYSLYAAYSIYKLQSSQSQGLFDMLSDDESESLWKNIIVNNIFAICKTRMSQLITLRTLVGFRDIKANIKAMPNMTSQVIVYKNLFIKTISDGKEYWNINNNENMKFDAIICNPPYQVNIGELKDNYGIPLYNHFVDVARDMKPNFISMIMPSRWFTGGRGLDVFRKSMLTDKHIRFIHDFVDSKDCFPTVDISGGIGYFLWDAKHKDKCVFTSTLHGKSNTQKRSLDEFSIFIRNNDALTLIHKVMSKTNDMLNSQVSGQTPFGFVTTYRGDKECTDDGATVLLKSSGSPSYVGRDEIKKNKQWVDKYKVIFSKATCEHAGTPDRNGQFRVLSSMSILPPGVICTQSYLVGGVFEDEKEATNFLKYLRTKFVRYLILQTITSQDLSPEKFMFIPQQDFSDNSDINWDLDTDGIDSQMYKKYDITNDETELVNRTIKPM